MKLRFDSTLQYQLDAIKAVTHLFDGMPSTADTNLCRSFPKKWKWAHIPNSESRIRRFWRGISSGRTLHKVQSGNDIPKSVKLFDASDAYQFPNFSVEMETGTGKTYVYLRTIFELNRLYGFKKFIIVAVGCYP